MRRRLTSLFCERLRFCHSETVTDVTVVGIRNPLRQRKERIAAPVCGLARNDRLFRQPEYATGIFLNVSPLSVNASRCHLSQRERQGQAAPQPFNVPAAYIVRTGTQGQIFHTSYR